ncbi:MAG: ferritin-like domain-containing protein [Bryobacteraceae bacterium]|jgi:ferritin-like metal-binding protein YciE
MKIETLQDLFLDELRDLYDAEKQLVKALPKMAAASSSIELRQAFENHLVETEAHVERLETIFSEMDAKSGGETCDAMKGLIKEGDKLASNVDESPLRDAGLIGAGNRVEHYEIAAYGTARTFAEKLGLSNAVELLEATLEEEEEADRKLTEIAENIVNDNALEIGAKL